MKLCIANDPGRPSDPGEREIGRKERQKRSMSETGKDEDMRTRKVEGTFIAR